MLNYLLCYIIAACESRWHGVKVIRIAGVSHIMDSRRIKYAFSVDIAAAVEML